MFTWAACNSAIPSLISAWEETLIILATCGKKVRRQQETKRDKKTTDSKTTREERDWDNRQKTTREERETVRPGQERSQPTPLWCWCWPAPPDNMALTSSRSDQIQWAASPPRTASASSGRASAQDGLPGLPLWHEGRGQQQVFAISSPAPLPPWRARRPAVQMMITPTTLTLIKSSNKKLSGFELCLAVLSNSVRKANKSLKQCCSRFADQTRQVQLFNVQRVVYYSPPSPLSPLHSWFW